MERRRPSVGEEIANSVSHGLGAVLSVAGLAAMVVQASLHGDAWRIVTCAVYGTTLVLLYMASTLYHALTNARAKRVFQVLDHSAIFLLIAGTYTPFTLVTLGGGWGWSLFGLVWALAAAGVTFKCFFTGRAQILSTAIYIAMGWCVVIALRPLVRALPAAGLVWLVAGGLAYTAGVFFFAARWRYAHAVWHACVLAGSVCHFCAVFGFVATLPA